MTTTMTTASSERRRHPAPAGAAPIAAATLALLLALGCSAQTESAASAATSTTATPVAILAAPVAILPDDAAIHLELAVTPEETASGLMFRPTLPRDRGMLFLFPADRVPAFWMKNTLIPLDLVFLDRSGKVVDLIEDVQPCAAEPCPQYLPDHPARAVLEIGAGVAAEHHVAVGDTIRFEHVEGYPVQEQSR